MAQPRSKTCRFSIVRAGCSCGLALAVFLFGSKALQNAVAEGETRTISMHHIHTDENITITYMRNGRYDEAALEKINWFLRDWRRSKETRMDPHLIDLLWEVHRETGANEPIYIVCGYRSPETNAMLRRRSHGVARYSQHTLGHAVDFYIPGVPLTEVRVIGLRMQRGGVGFYPTSGSPFVHMDTGGVRMWPRMSREQLLNVFPDGRTAYVPSDGHPLAGYTLALADLKKRGQDPKVTWFAEARARGLDKNIVLASDEQQRDDPFDRYHDMSRADRDEDALEAAGDAASAKAEPVAATETSAAQSIGREADNPLLAALEREAARRREGRLLLDAAPSEHGALYQIAAFVEPAAAAEASPNSDAAPRAAKAPNAVAMRLAAAVSPADTGAIADAGRPNDHVPPDLALSYAGGTEQQAANAQSPLPQPPAATTIAIKRTGDQPFSTIVTAPALVADGASAATASSRANAKIIENNPWLDAVMVSSSITRLTALALGEPDFLALAPLVEKPAQTVMMTFSNDPSGGLAADHFSGRAVVFMSTVTYRQEQQNLALH